MIVLGVLGGIASGKSLVCNLLRECGAEILEADQEGHVVLCDPAVRDELVRRWGTAVLDAAHDIDRRAVARRVFAPPPEGPRDRRFLEQLTHPRIGERIQAKLAQLTRTQASPVVVLDAALLLEAGWERWCDALVFVHAEASTRQQRATQRGWTARDWAAREAVQWPLERKQSHCRWTIDNNGSPEETRRQVEKLWRELLQENTN